MPTEGNPWLLFQQWGPSLCNNWGVSMGKLWILWATSFTVDIGEIPSVLCRNWVWFCPGFIGDTGEKLIWIYIYYVGKSLVMSFLKLMLWQWVFLDIFESFSHLNICPSAGLIKMIRNISIILCGMCLWFTYYTQMILKNSYTAFPLVFRYDFADLGWSQNLSRKFQGCRPDREVFF